MKYDNIKPSRERRAQTMFKFFKNNNKIVESYSVLLCDDNNANTAFGIYGTYETYKKADNVIRMAWNKTKEQKIDNGYKIKDAWIVIKKN